MHVYQHLHIHVQINMMCAKLQNLDRYNVNKYKLECK